MLAIDDRLAEGCFALLEEQRVTPAGDGCGLQLNMARRVSCPGPTCRCAMGMAQLVEKNLSPPRGLLCCRSVTKAFPWNIHIHAPCMLISIGIGVELGWALVPDEAWSSISSRKLAARIDCFIGCMLGVWVGGHIRIARHRLRARFREQAPGQRRPRKRP